MVKSSIALNIAKENKMPSVSAVVVNFNGGDVILSCLQALYRQDIPLTETIVVDNGSIDGSLDTIRNFFPNVRIVELGENRGLPAARNIGLRLATTDLVLLNTSDVYVAKDALRHLLEAYRQNQPTVVCPRVLLFPEIDIVQCDGAAVHFVGTLLLRHGYCPLKDAPANAVSVGGCIGACLLVNRNQVLAVGGFDEAYFHYFEDLEFSIRLLALGHQFVCNPAALVYHNRGEGTPEVAFRGQGSYPPLRGYLTLRGRVRTVLIYYSIRTLVVLSPVLAVYEIVCLVAAFFRGWGNQWMRAWLWQIKNARDIWKRRQDIQRRRSRQDKDLLVGGELPLAPGFVRSGREREAVAALSAILNSYWHVARRWIG